MDDPSHMVQPPEAPRSPMPNPAHAPPLNMPPQPPAGMPGQMHSDQDVEHIRILSICYYVMAGVTALLACFPIFHLFIGVMMLTGSFGGGGMSAHDKEGMQMVGGMFVGVSSLIILTGWLLAVMNFIVARRIVKRESKVLCLVIAGINCLNMPFGTVLGVFTFIVLNRPQVIQSFDENRPQE